jgi:hypothetical protein
MHAGDTIDSVTAGSPFSLLDEAWLADLRMDVDRADSTKELYERELRTLVLPTFEHFTLREVTVGRTEHFLTRNPVIIRSNSDHRAPVALLGSCLDFLGRGCGDLSSR